MPICGEWGLKVVGLGVVNSDLATRLPLLEFRGGDFEAASVYPQPVTMLRIQGYKGPNRAPRAVVEAAERMAARARALAAPALQYRMVPLPRIGECKVNDEQILISPGAEAEKVLSSSVALLPVLLTMGPQFDEETDRLRSRGEMVEALFFETAGWMSLEGTTKSFTTWIRERIRVQGYTLTRRLAPGYGTWPLSGQRDLFGLFGTAALPVRLSDSLLMTPKMSRSGLFGLMQISR